jgi:hypothetical protein
MEKRRFDSNADATHTHIEQRLEPISSCARARRKLSPCSPAGSEQAAHFLLHLLLSVLGRALAVRGTGRIPHITSLLNGTASATLLLARCASAQCIVLMQVRMLHGLAGLRGQTPCVCHLPFGALIRPRIVYYCWSTTSDKAASCAAMQGFCGAPSTLGCRRCMGFLKL